MKLKDGFYLERVEGQNVIKCNAQNIRSLDSVITLNKSASFLFRCLESGEKTKEQLLKLTLENLDVSTVMALNDIDVFVKTLTKNGIIEE